MRSTSLPLFAACLLLLLGACQGHRVPVSPTTSLMPIDVAPSAPSSAPSDLEPELRRSPRMIESSGSPLHLARPQAQSAQGRYTLNMVDADIRDVVQNVLGTVLKLNYTIDPAVKGAASIHTSRPVSRGEALEMLDAALGQVGANLVESNGFYRVVPNGKVLTAPSLVGAKGVGSGMDVVALRYASAVELVKTLQPFIEQSGRMQADAGRNAIIVLGDASNRVSIVDLIRTFDVDLLAHQSYALFPIVSGTPSRVAAELDKALQSKEGASLSGVIRVVPMESVNALLVVARDRHYLDDVGRILQMVDREAGESERRWYVYYVQSTECAELAYVLQRAFTPANVTFEGLGIIAGEPWGMGWGKQGSSPSGISTQNQSGNGGSGQVPGLGQNIEGGGSAIDTSVAGLDPTAGSSGASSGTAPGVGSATVSSAELSTPLALKGTGDTANPQTTQGLRVVANPRNNELLIHATRAEYRVIESTLRKMDVSPLQVKIDAVIAEVTLNDTLQYGTQFFLKNGSLSGILSQGATAALTQDFPGFVLSRSTSNVQFAIEALRSVTNVKVLSSPEVTVVDNEQAVVQSGERVPYVTQTAISTQQSDAPIVNSINYANTGVILQVRPRINAGNRISLYIAQEVNDPINTTTSTINSPSFNDRSVRSHVIIEDGQTIGLAGLIRDNATEGNAGLPFLKDIPILGSLFSNQSNTRQRTELLVLITPHIIHDQREARLLTEELREKLLGASFVPQALSNVLINSSANPNAELGR